MVLLTKNHKLSNIEFTHLAKIRSPIWPKIVRPLVLLFTPPPEGSRRMFLVHLAERRASMEVLPARAFRIRNDKAFHLIPFVEDTETDMACRKLPQHRKGTIRLPPHEAVNGSQLW